MGDTINSDVIKKTQNTLGKFIKKPPLSEKLLKKPPFRFLHDIVNVVIKETGFLRELYTEDELISDNIKDRNAKIQFLQKLIDVIKIVTGDTLTARPSKIVAGQEPEKTNELLQAIGIALEKKLSSKDAVSTVLNGNKIINTTNKQKNISNKKDVKLINNNNNSDKVKKIDTNKDNNKRIIDNTIKVKEINKKIEKIKENTNGNSKLVGKTKVVTSVAKSKPINKISNETLVNRRNSDNKIKEFEPTIIKTDTLISNNNKIINESEIIVESNEKVQIDNEDGTLQSKIEKPLEIIETEITSVEKIENDIQPVVTTNNEINEVKQNDLIDVIDQEAERRRNDRVEKRSSRHRQKAQQNFDETDKEASSLEPDIGKSPKKKELSRLKHQSSRDKFPKLEDEFGNKVSIDKNSLNSELVHQNAEDKGDSVESLENSVKTTDLNKRSYIRQEAIGDKVVPRPRTSLRPPSVRPASARPGAPRRRDKNVEIILQPEETIKLGEINVKVENYNIELEDDGENLIIIEDPMVQDNFDQAINGEMLEGGGEGMADIDGANQQGHLVQQILETQKEFSINKEGDEIKKNINEEEWDSVTKRQRETSGKQMDTLRDSIQKLTRSINPLGKLMDFIQEDTDSMQREIIMWRDVFQHTNHELLKERSLTENAIEPLKNQLIQIDNNIKDYIEMINTSRTNIIQNDEKINKLLGEM